MNRNNLAIDYSELENISYDNKAMVEELICNINIKLEGNQSPYPKQTIIETIAVYIVIGILRQTARIMGIPYRTVFGWSKASWWEDAINQVSILNKQLVNARTAKIINKAFDNVEKRFSQGDYATYDTDLKEIIYKPVSAKDSAVIFGVMFDKQRINNSLATHITTTTTTHLLDIKAQFESMTNKPTIEADTVERIE